MLPLNDRRLFQPTPLADALAALADQHGGRGRAAPDAREFAGRPHSYELLNQYAAGQQWRALALAAEATIQATPIQSASDEAAVLRLWTYRALALVRLAHAAAAARELQAVEAATRGTSVYARFRARAPTVVWPFELRVLRAQLPGLAHGDWRRTCERVCALLRACERRAGDANAQRRFRLQMLLAGAVLRLRDAALAAALLARLDAADDPRVLSACARLHLQLGSLPHAELLFRRVEARVPADDKLLLMNRAMYAVAAGKWAVARDLFARVASDPLGEPHVAAANNAAVCELFLGSPQRMLAQLQLLMADSPTAAGSAAELVFNYCTALDLLHDGPALLAEKSRKIADVATWAGDGFDTSAFKMQ
ncbi:hypothetical protein H4S02_000362 [Coemansia sp. RSA 2611]|nr:hypothetical protein H4S01_000731 [Coemansia sp. RSA 2610]KAJ2393188.1 hypothetical protein H4S02_000362 [Coemansia sp. RSA 2611]